jgi:hypothetical protein
MYLFQNFAQINVMFFDNAPILSSSLITEPKVTTQPKLYSYNEILFFRLRTGYIKLNSYLNKIGFNPSNLCDTCQQEETVGHFLLNCKLYDTYRKTMIDQLLQLGVTNFNLITLLSGKNFQPVADYINQANRF